MDDSAAYRLLSTDGQHTAQYAEEYQRARDLMNAKIAFADEFVTNDAEHRDLAEFRAFTDGPAGYLASSEQAFSAVTSGHRADATKAFSKLFPGAATGSLDRLVAESTARVNAGNAEAQGREQAAKTLSYVVGLGALILGIAIALILSRNISTSLGATTRALNESSTRTLRRLPRPLIVCRKAI